MLEKIKKWFTPKTKTKLGRPKLAKKGVLKAAKIELALAFVLVATVALAGTSTLTGRSPLELLTFGLASKASGGAYAVTPTTNDFICGSKKIGTYAIEEYTTNNSLGNGGISFSGGASKWVGEQVLHAEIISGRNGVLTKARYSIYTSDTNVAQCSGEFNIIKGQYQAVKIKIVIGRDKNNKIINGVALYSTMYVSGQYKNVNTNTLYDTDSDKENIRVDRAAPSVNTLNVYMDKYFKIVAKVRDPGEGRGHMVFNIYKYLLEKGDTTGSYIISKSELYDNKTTDERKSFYLSTLGEAGYFILKASIIDDVGNKGTGKDVCFKSTMGLAVSNGTVSEITCSKYLLSISGGNMTKTKGTTFTLKATTNLGQKISWKTSNKAIVDIVDDTNSTNSSTVKLLAKETGKAEITAKTDLGLEKSITVTVNAATNGNKTNNTVAPNSRTSQSGGGGNTNTNSRTTTTVTSKKQVDVSEIVGGVVITITPDPTSPYTTIKYGKVAKMITTFTRTPSTLPPRYRQWYTYYKDKASDKWVLNWGTKDSITGQVAPCTLVKDTVGASPTLSMNHKYRVGKWLIYSDSKCTKHLGSVLTPVYTAY